MREAKLVKHEGCKIIAMGLSQNCNSPFFMSSCMRFIDF